MIAFAYALGIVSTLIAAIIFWGGFVEEGRATRISPPNG
jgi:hypothetical protein